MVVLEGFHVIVGDNRVSYDYHDGWFCTCEDFYYRKHECKHILAVKNDEGLVAQVENSKHEPVCYEKMGIKPFINDAKGVGLSG